MKKYYISKYLILQPETVGKASTHNGYNTLKEQEKSDYPSHSCNTCKWMCE